MAAKILRVLGYVLLSAGTALVVIGTIAVYLKSGFWAVSDLFSPFNVVNYIAVLVTLAPGGLCLYLADRLTSAR